MRRGGSTFSLAVTAASLAAGCLDQTYVFVCKASADCAAADGRSGVCETSGRCSFADPACPSGRRYGGYAGGDRGGACTECGNGAVDPGEECDDGNAATDDACLPTCRWNVCGDGFLRKIVEECDDGNTADGDSCNHNCLACAGGNAHFSWPDDGHCYLRFDAPHTWEEAQQACTAALAHLVAYNSEVEQVAVRAQLLTAVPGAHWIGLHDPGSGYEWITGEPVVMPMRDFASPLPAGLCTANTASVGAWTAAACASADGFICENPGWAVDPKHHHAYRAFYHQPQWMAARAACETIGAHLVTITDRDEQDFISAQFFGTFWLGGIRSGTAAGDGWTWVTGEAFMFAPFADGEPDDSARPTCLALGPDHRWHDRACDGSVRGPFGYICEVD